MGTNPPTARPSQPGHCDEGGVRQEQSTLTTGPSSERHEDGVSGRIDLGARLGPALTACIGVTTRGVRAAHTYAQGARRPESATMAAPRTWHKRMVRSGPRTAPSPAADSGADFALRNRLALSGSTSNRERFSKPGRCGREGYQPVFF